MLSYYKTVDGRITRIDSRQKDCWVNLVTPTEEELNQIMEDFSIDPSFIRSALDEEEISRIESEDGITLIIVDFPVAEKQENTILYSTLPLGIIVTPDAVITLSGKENLVLNEFADGLVKNVNTHMKTRFILQLLLRIAGRYLAYLKQIDKISGFVEKQLHKSLRNKEIIQLMDIGKSLVYFSASLKATEVTLQKMQSGRYIRMYEEDMDLLDDVLIEIRQADDMANIYSSILNGTMDAFASIISNNLNVVMKILTSLTILMAIPTVVSSFYGMNIGGNGMPFAQFWWFPILLSALLVVLGAYILDKFNMLK